MQTKRITIEVPAKTAEAYERAPESVRRRARRAVEFALQTREEIVVEFDRLTKRMRDHAAEQGLTSAQLDALLSEEDDA